MRSTGSALKPLLSQFSRALNLGIGSGAPSPQRIAEIQQQADVIKQEKAVLEEANKIIASVQGALASNDVNEIQRLLDSRNVAGGELDSTIIKELLSKITTLAKGSQDAGRLDNETAIKVDNLLKVLASLGPILQTQLRVIQDPKRLQELQQGVVDRGNLTGPAKQLDLFKTPDATQNRIQIEENKSEQQNRILEESFKRSQEAVNKNTEVSSASINKNTIAVNALTTKLGNNTPTGSVSIGSIQVTVPEGNSVDARSVASELITQLPRLIRQGVLS